MDQLTEQQKKEFEASRYHEADGTYRGDFGGPAEPAVATETPAASEQPDAGSKKVAEGKQ